MLRLILNISLALLAVNSATASEQHGAYEWLVGHDASSPTPKRSHPTAPAKSMPHAGATWTDLGGCARVFLTRSAVEPNKLALFATDTKASDKNFDFSINGSRFQERDKQIEYALDSDIPVSYSPIRVVPGDILTVRKRNSDGIWCTVSAKVTGSVVEPELTLVGPEALRLAIESPSEEHKKHKARTLTTEHHIKQRPDGVIDRARPLSFSGSTVNQSTPPLIPKPSITPTQPSQPTTPIATPQPEQTSDQQPYEIKFLAWLNNFRAQRGLKALKYSASAKRQAIANNVQQRLRGLGHYVFSPYYNRQNSAIGTTLDGVISGWVNSPAHLAAFLDPSIYAGAIDYDGYGNWTFNADKPAGIYGQ